MNDILEDFVPNMNREATTSQHARLLTRSTTWECSSEHLVIGRTVEVDGCS